MIFVILVGAFTQLYGYFTKLINDPSMRVDLSGEETTPVSIMLSHHQENVLFNADTETLISDLIAKMSVPPLTDTIINEALRT